MRKEAIIHLILAYECLLEVKRQNTLLIIKRKLLRIPKKNVEVIFHQTSANQKIYAFDEYASDKITEMIAYLGSEEDTLPWLKEQVEKHNHNYFRSRGTFSKDESSPPNGTFFRAFAISALKSIVDIWKEQEEIISWLQYLSQKSNEPIIRGAALQELARSWSDSPETLSIIKDRIQQDEDEIVRRVALEELANRWKEHPETLPYLKKYAVTDTGYARASAVVSLSSNWKDDPETFSIIRSCIESNQAQTDFYARKTAVQCLAYVWKNHPKTLNILIDRSQKDEHEFVRNHAINALSSCLDELPKLLNKFYAIAMKDPFEHEFEWECNPRQSSLKALLFHYPIHPKTTELLRDRAVNDPDEKLQEWAQGKLRQLKIPNKEVSMDG